MQTEKAREKFRKKVHLCQGWRYLPVGFSGLCQHCESNHILKRHLLHKVRALLTYSKYNSKRAKIHKSCIKTNYWSILESFQSRGLQHLLVSTLTVSKQWTDNLQARTSNQRSKNLQARELILILLTTNAGWEQTVIERSRDTELKYLNIWTDIVQPCISSGVLWCEGPPAGCQRWAALKDGTLCETVSTTAKC